MRFGGTQLTGQQCIIGARYHGDRYAGSGIAPAKKHRGQRRLTQRLAAVARRVDVCNIVAGVIQPHLRGAHAAQRYLEQ